MERTSGTQDARVGYDTSRPVGSFFRVVVDVLIRPSDFFARLRSSEEGVDFTSSGTTWRQIAFTMICLLISGLLNLVSDTIGALLRNSQTGTDSVIEFVLREPLFAVGIALLALIVWPLSALLVLYIGTFFYQVFVWLFIRQDNRSYWATFPVMAYVNAVFLVTWIPVVGAVISLYTVYVTMCGLRAMHDTTTKKALLAALPVTLIGLAPYLQTL